MPNNITQERQELRNFTRRATEALRQRVPGYVLAHAVMASNLMGGMVDGEYQEHPLVQMARTVLQGAGELNDKH